MKDGLRFVDSDMHIMEPPDLFDRFLDPKFKHRVSVPVGSDGTSCDTLVLPSTKGAEIPAPDPITTVPVVTGDLYSSGHPELTCTKGQFQGYTVWLTRPGQAKRQLATSRKTALLARSRITGSRERLSQSGDTVVASASRIGAARSALQYPRHSSR